MVKCGESRGRQGIFMCLAALLIVNNFSQFAMEVQRYRQIDTRIIRIDETLLALGCI